MGYGKQSFGAMLNQQSAALLPYLDELNRSHVTEVSRTQLLDHSGLKDNELQKLIHDGNLPRHQYRKGREKIYQTEACLKQLARYTNRYEYIIKED